MLKCLLLTFTLAALPQAHAQKKIQVPMGCVTCMSECPHDTKIMKDCDRGCPDDCSRAQAKEYLDSIKRQESKEDCYTCMSGCPHLSRDIKDCDEGCPKVCNLESMRHAFLKANEKAKDCAPRAGERPGQSGVIR